MPKPDDDGMQLQDVMPTALRCCMLRVIQAATVRLLTQHLDAYNTV